MILKSAVFISALKAAYKELGMTATYAQLAGLSFKATAGQFMIILHKFDETSAVDVPVLNFFKTLTDVPGAAEDATLQFFKVLAENGVVTDDQIVSFFKVVPAQLTSVNYSVTVQSTGAGNKYYIDASGPAPTISLVEGVTYRFDQSISSNNGHPLRFSTISNGTHAGGSEYTTGVTTSGTPGTSGAYTQIVVAENAPTLYYYCTNHSGMGGLSHTPVVPETVLTSDVPAKTLVKTPQDLSSASENFAKSTTHPHADSAGATESFIKLLVINRAFSDTSSSTDALASAFSTERNDAAAVTDSETTAMVKFLTNTAFATDDVDGSSTIEDDQEMQFFKNSTDGVGATDVFVRVLNKGAFLANTAAATDAGLLRSQNYSDFTYFDGDYVGISRALT